MKLIELCRAADIFCPSELCDVEITSVTSNSKKVRPGSLFVCLDGTKRDGNQFAEEALSNGAAAVLSDKRDDLPLKTNDSRRALAFLCRKLYGQGIERLKLVGVTGTNGKTSVTAILSSVLSAAGCKVGTVGTLGCFLGENRLPCPAMTTPDPEELYPILAKMASDGANYAVLELSSHALANKKADALEFEVGIFTNITRDHLDFHKTKENYFESKKRIFELSRIGIVNADDPMLKNIEGVLTCSAQARADFMAHDVTYYGTRGCGYAFLSELCRFGVVSKIPGRFTVMNTLLAAAAAVTLGISPEYVKEGIYSLSAVDGRMERVELKGADFSVYIDYAHTPDALENLLLTVKGFAPGKIILIFGCGGERDRGKRAQMASIASRLADKIVITSDNSRGESKKQIFDDIFSGIDKSCDFCLIESRKEAIEKAVFDAKSGDVILLAGKGHEKYEIDSTGKHPFDEAEIVKNAYKIR